MFVLGVNGGRRRIDETDPDGMYHHDAAAVILRDGELLAAIEEERLNRIKHSNSFPEAAISHCLDAAGVTLAEVDIIAINSSIDHSEREAKLEFFMDRQIPSPPSARSFWDRHFREHLELTSTQNCTFVTIIWHMQSVHGYLRDSKKALSSLLMETGTVAQGWS